ncbi:hypothetical protein IFM89_019951 [Coptis chinensis]|uniref:Glabrous enhancer-binding protein-like DBD domain-containing protein n=1 Tax=Coptis chinensis TaxID=261450 RepID=A0A835HIP4_9MAGN|nr:hypothetical protein IFM89_019951 [Coptis chinensis]
MAKKRPAPLEQPPSPSSSEEETQKHEESSEEEEETQNPSSNKPKSDEQDSDSEEVESENKSDSGGSESDDDDDDDVPVKHMLAPRTTTETTTTTTTVKPISSKPMTTDSSSKPKKPVSTNTTVFALVAKKDKSGSDKDTRKERKKKKVSELEEEKKKGDVDKDKDKKNASAKLWSENDETVILKGLIEFKKKGKNAGSDLTGFLDFIKEGLDADANRDQLKSKLQRLKQKYQSSSGGFTKPHEVKLFELSKQIWGEKSGGVVDAGNNGAGDSVVEDGKKRKRQKSANGVALQKKGDTPMVEAEAEDNGNGSGYLYLNASTLQGHLIKPPQELGEVFLKNGWDLVGNANAKELDQRWKTVMIAETKAYIQCLDLVRDQTKLMLEALESSNL